MSFQEGLTAPPNFTPTKRSDVYDTISPLKGLAGAADGLSVLITGSGRGLGRSIALSFAQAGAEKVVITARTASELDEVEAAIRAVSQKTKVVKVKASVTSEEDVDSLFKMAGDLDVCINNAGALEDWALPISKSSIDAWWGTWEINLKGTYLVSRRFLQAADADSPKRSRKLTLINTSSIGSTFTKPNAAAYGGSKSAVNRFTEFVHYDYPNTVRAFAYHPGGVVTALAKGLPSHMHATLTDAPELAGGYAVWLATSEDADFLRGRYSSCNWDITELLERKAEVVEKNLFWTVVRGQELERA